MSIDLNPIADQCVNAYQHGRLDEADALIVNAFADAVIDEPNCVAAAMLLRVRALVLAARQQWGAALMACAQAEQTGGQSPDLHAIGGLAAEALGDDLQAFGCWASAHVFRSHGILEGSGTWLAQMAMGRILARAGRLAAAATHYCDALESNDPTLTAETRQSIERSLADVRSRWAAEQSAKNESQKVDQ